MKMFLEEDVLREDWRAVAIKEITEGEENIDRRNEHLKRHEIYRDRNKKWVMSEIEKEGYRQVTVEQMRNRASNISVCRKIVNKLATTYIGGVDRTVEDESSQESIDMISDELDFNTQMKKSDRYRQLHKNALIGIVPVLDTEESKSAGSLRYYLCMKILAPYQYDVVEDAFEPAVARCIILSEFLERDRMTSILEQAGAEGRRFRELGTRDGDGRDQIIADSPADMGRGFEGSEKERTFIFWTTNYHLTCFSNGKLVPGMQADALRNPIQLIPWVTLSMDQDGAYWAEGGEDVVDGSILVNKKITDLHYIAFTQGWGQMVIAARDIPKKLIGGPDNAFLFEMKDGDPTPFVEFATSNPPLESWLRVIESYLALLLSTNNLSVRGIAAKLDASNVASGVAIMLDNAEVLTDNKDVQVLFQDAEPEIWEVIRRWHDLYSKAGALTPKFQAIKPFTDSSVKLKFTEVRPPISENEKLAALKLRKELGISTMIEILKLDNPDLSDEEATTKAKELNDDSKARSLAVGTLATSVEKPNASIQQEDQVRAEVQANANDQTNSTY